MSKYFMQDTRITTANQRSVCGGGRRRSVVSEPCRLRRGEGCGACDDAMMEPPKPRGSEKPKKPRQRKQRYPFQKNGGKD